MALAVLFRCLMLVAARADRRDAGISLREPRAARRRGSARTRWCVGGRCGQPVLADVLRRLGAAAELPEELRHPHALRHTCATELLRAGATIADVRVFLGHASVTTTSIYLGSGDERQEEIVQRRPAPLLAKMSALNFKPVHVYGLTETYAPYTICERQEAWADDFCRDHLAHFKAPAAVAFGELPKTSTGKVQKYLLREREWAGRTTRVN